MKLDQLTAYGANTKEGLHRCLDDEAFYLRMVKKIPDDPNFQKLFDAVEAGDLAAGFDAAHALKGSTGNLSLTPISAPVTEITELLRARTDTDYSALLAAIREGRDRLAELCAE